MISAHALTKTFGDATPVDHISFQVEPGEIFGFLGSNGAGKSTTMLMLTTLLKPTSGRALVAGYDVAENPAQVRRHIGYVQQESSIDEYLTGRENMILQARLDRIKKDIAASRIDEMLESMGLEERQHDSTVTYSGGMKKRLDIACGLLHYPDVLFLDEPTVGLDIQTRHRIWEGIRRMREEHGTTVFVSTHYMEEADSLCDRVCIIDRGAIKKIGRPREMKEELDQKTIIIGSSDDAALAGRIGSIAGVESVSGGGERIRVRAHGAAEVIHDIFSMADAMDIRIISMSMSGPSMDDVFMSYTGHQIREGDES